ANPTIIDGQGVRRGIRLQRTYSTAPAASLYLAGFTVRNGLAMGASSGTTDDTYAFGGGLLSEHASVVLEDMVFVNNVSRGGTTTSAGGAGAGGAVAVNTTWGGVVARMSRVRFDGNQALGGDGAVRGGHGIGGALFTYGIQLEGADLTFLGNKATAGSTATGGGVADGNRADAHGAAAAFHGGSSVTLRSLTASGNVARGGNAPLGEAGGAFGGGVFVEDSDLKLADAVLKANQALGGTGRNATTLAGQAWGGGLASMNANVAVFRAQVIANLARGGDGAVYGGAVSGGGITNSAVTSTRRTAEVVNCIIADNEAYVGTGQLVGGGGGGLWFLGVSARVVHSTVAHNRVQQSLLGQGVILVNHTQPTTLGLVDSVISDHTGLVNTAALHAQAGTTVSVARLLYANNTINDNHSLNLAGAPGTFSGLSTAIATTDPVGYRSPGAPNYDYHILRGSVARDLVTSLTVFNDIDGDVRSGTADLGADEYLSPVDLYLRPLDATTLLSSWAVSGELTTASDIKRYRLYLTCEAGAASPQQVACGSSIDVGLDQTSLLLTNLTEFAHYTATLAVVDANGQVIETSNAAVAFPTHFFTFVPLVTR
ncbi:MAG: hypothetical protein JXC32_06100, partial [Anaerolineae bacterium]|nr:hypothetical protein [Anaerolineae bacterium]